MYVYISLIFILLTVYCFTRLTPKLRENYSRFRQLNNLVSFKHKAFFKILWISLKMLAKMQWYRFLQWSNDTVVHLDKHTAIFSYTLQGKVYKEVIHLRKGPCFIILITDEDSEDVTDTILPYFGPNQDWNKKEFTPGFWDKDELVFELSNGETKTFGRNERINLN